jgi:hypothetical protein
MSDSTHADLRAAWLRSLGWQEGPDGRWTAQVASSRFGRYAPMSLDHAFDVALKRSVIDKRFRIEIHDGRIRLALPWRELAPEDLDRPDETA